MEGSSCGVEGISADVGLAIDCSWIVTECAKSLKCYCSCRHSKGDEGEVENHWGIYQDLFEETSKEITLSQRYAVCTSSVGKQRKSLTQAWHEWEERIETFR